VLEVLFRFVRDVADPLFLLENGDEISRDGHALVTARSAFSGDRQDGAESTWSLSIPWQSA
jgi:hypothetical protein